MKRFWVLAWDQYYPLGGLDNVKETFDNLPDAEEYAKTLKADWVEIEDVGHLLGID